MMPYLSSITLKPSGTLSTRISKESSICESSAVPVLAHLGHRWFSTQCSRDAIPQICTCGCSDQHQFAGHSQNSKNVSSYVAWNHLIDAEGRSCIYVPITQNGKVVDSQGFTFEQSRGSVVLDREHGEASAMMIDPEAKLLAVLDHAETYRGLAIRAKDRGERESYERIVELYVEIAEELEALIDGWASP